MDKNIIGRLENVLFAAGDAMEISLLAEYFNMSDSELSQAIDEEIDIRQNKDGLIFKKINEKVQLCTRPDYAVDIYNLLGKKSSEELTKAMLETLSIIAYKQPVTRQEVEELRGVNSSYIMNSLLAKKLIKEAGRKQVLGRPILYKTDEEFLRHFGIKNLEELPKLPDNE